MNEMDRLSIRATGMGNHSIGVNEMTPGYVELTFHVAIFRQIVRIVARCKSEVE